MIDVVCKVKQPNFNVYIMHLQESTVFSRIHVRYLERKEKKIKRRRKFLKENIFVSFEGIKDEKKIFFDKKYPRKLRN